MKKKFILLLCGLFILTGCGQKTQIVGDIQDTPTSLEESMEFDRVFEEFTSLTEDIREEKEEEIVRNSYNSQVNLKEEINQFENVDVSEYTEEELGVVVDFIDVGQGDSILIKSNNEYMLIDTGDTKTSKELVNYVTSKTSTLKYFVATHPHKDHIGGAKDIISNVEISKIIMPDVSYDNNKAYGEMLDIIDEREIEVLPPIVGEEFELGETSFMILAPNNNEYDDLNNYSVVIKLTFGDNSFLFMGDAESASEKEMMETGFDLSADVLKVGHHGSKYSTSSKFLDTINPSVAVIEVGENNQYNHPHDDLISKLTSRNILTYRTDLNGTISIGSDGVNLYAISEKEDYTSKSANDFLEDEKEEIIEESTVLYPEDAETYIVYQTRDNVYHNEGCIELNKVNTQITLSIAREMNLVPCSRCKPMK